MTDHNEWEYRRCSASRRLRRRIQNRLWTRDEEWAIEKGYRSRRSAGGWSITVRDPRWDRRTVCDGCAGTGRGTGGDDCTECAGAGILTRPDGDGGTT